LGPNVDRCRRFDSGCEIGVVSICPQEFSDDFHRRAHGLALAGKHCRPNGAGGRNPLVIPGIQIGAISAITMSELINRMARLMNVRNSGMSATGKRVSHSVINHDRWSTQCQYKITSRRVTATNTARIQPVGTVTESFVTKPGA
jgi:hypothetical protein